MADASKVLAQANPLAATLTTLYTVPAATSAVASSLVVANRSATATSFRISIAVAGAADSLIQYTHYDVAIEGNETYIATIGVTLATTDVVRCYATLATCTFNLFGIEIT